MYVYPIIPLNLVKKFIASLYTLKRVEQLDKHYYGLIKTFITSFKLEDINNLIDKPDYDQFINTLKTNPFYDPDNGSMILLQFTPIYCLWKWLLHNLYEGPPINFRSDYTEGVFNENVSYIVGTVKFLYCKDLFLRLNTFVCNFEEQNLLQLTKDILCFPHGIF
jgi:hypothetical protein